jgi:predicted dehydrogenase
MEADQLVLKAIYSRSLKSAQETAELVTKSDVKPDLYSADSGVGKTYHDVLLREDISAVILALPIVSQPEYIEAALKAGKHVLAEKPIGPDVATARRLLEFYYKEAAEKKVTFTIAENIRFTPKFVYAGQQAQKLGKVTLFNVRILGLMRTDNKYYNTAWRTKPEYQGGFLLDGGVHHAAAVRLLLPNDKCVSTEAYTALLQPYLPPIDTVNAIVKTASGAVGTYQHSAGTLLSGASWDFVYEGGVLQITGDSVKVTPKDGAETVKDFPRSSGVKEEVKAWAEGLESGKMPAFLSPENALADLEFLEQMFTSGDENGTPKKFEFQ